MTTPHLDDPAGSLAELERRHHVDREALVAQVRALSSAVEQLADAVEASDRGDHDAVARHLDQARWPLGRTW